MMFWMGVRNTVIAIISCIGFCSMVTYVGTFGGRLISQFFQSILN